MLVISRKKGQRIFINGKEIILTVLRTDGQLVELGFDADKSIPINREELEKQLERKPFRNNI